MNKRQQTKQQTKAAGELLRFYRQEAGMSMREAAQKKGLPHSTIAKMEVAERRITVNEFFYWAGVYGVSVTQAAINLEQRVGKFEI